MKRHRTGDFSPDHPLESNTNYKRLHGCAEVIYVYPSLSRETLREIEYLLSRMKETRHGEDRTRARREARETPV